MFSEFSSECNVINHYTECIINIGTVVFARFVHKSKKVLRAGLNLDCAHNVALHSTTLSHMHTHIHKYRQIHSRSG